MASALPPEEVGRRIRAARIAKGLTVNQLAQLMGVDWRTVQRWQAGTEKMKDGTIRQTLPRLTGPKGIHRLAEVLGVPARYFVETEEEASSVSDLAREVAALRAAINGSRPQDLEPLLERHLQPLQEAVALALNGVGENSAKLDLLAKALDERTLRPSARAEPRNGP